MIFEEIDVVWVVVPFIIAAAAYQVFVKRSADPMRDKINKLQVATALTGAFLMVMWLMLPQTPSLSTFGYPEDISDINSQEKILKLLQRYNKAIVRTTDVVKWGTFILVFWFMGSLYQLLKVLKERTGLNKE
jgi:amino acid transporter